jgi:DNA-binding XRE family transcriptional regulator
VHTAEALVGDSDQAPGTTGSTPRGGETIPMTPTDLVQWRERLGWSQEEAARQLGIGRRTYIYLEGGQTSRGKAIDFIPRLTELACAELERRHRKAGRD